LCISDIEILDHLAGDLLELSDPSGLCPDDLFLAILQRREEAGDAGGDIDRECREGDGGEWLAILSESHMS
jgi:hypothetical protein